MLTADMERMRRSIVMLPPGHSVGSFTREEMLAVFEQLSEAREDSQRYRELLDQIKELVARAE